MPREFGIVREQHSFDRYVTFAEWREQSFSEIFLVAVSELHKLYRENIDPPQYGAEWNVCEMWKYVEFP